MFCFVSFLRSVPCMLRSVNAIGLKSSHDCLLRRRTKGIEKLSGDLFAGTWQFYGEYCLCIGCAEHRDFSLVRAYYCLGNSKTETRARRRRFHFIISGNMLTSIETLKDMRKVVWMNTFAVINDLHQRMTILSVKLEFNPAFRGRTAVFDGIIK